MSDWLAATGTGAAATVLWLTWAFYLIHRRPSEPVPMWKTPRRPRLVGTLILQGVALFASLMTATFVRTMSGNLWWGLLACAITPLPGFAVALLHNWKLRRNT